MQYINLIIAILGLIIGLVGILISLKAMGRKILAYEVVSQTSLLHIMKLAKYRVQILFNNKPVDQVNRVVLKVWNSGNKPLQKSDYVKPITLDFGNAEILAIKILDTNPDDLEANPKHNLKNLILRPDLLNPGDRIRLEVLLTGYTGNVSMKVRVEGMRRVLHLKGASAYATIYSLCAAFGCLTFLATVVLTDYNKTSSLHTNQLIIILLLICSVVIVIIDVVVWFYLRIRKGIRIRLNDFGIIFLFFWSIFNLLYTISECLIFLIRPVDSLYY